MSIFRNRTLEEEHKIALTVIESDRRTKTQFELRKSNRELTRIITTMAVVFIAAAILFLLPSKRKRNELDQGVGGHSTEEQIR